MSTKWRLVIEIDGESAEELFPVGPKDLKEYFLPEMLNVREEDIKRIHFSEDLTSDEFGDALMGKRPRHVHADNYARDVNMIEEDAE